MQAFATAYPDQCHRPNFHSSHHLQRWRAQFGNLAFEFGDRRFKIEKTWHDSGSILGKADNWPSASGKSTFLGKWVMGLDHLPQPLGLHMGVDLCRRYVRMAQHLLDRPQIRPPGQEVAGEAVAQHVRRKLCGIDPGLAGQILQRQGEVLPRQVA